MTEEQYNMHRAADARALARLNPEPATEEIPTEPAPTEDELLAMDLAERQQHRQERINRKLGLPVPHEVKARQNWHRHAATLARIHTEIAPRLHALKVARADVFREPFAVSTRIR